MSTTAMPPPAAGPRVKRWTVAEFHQLGDLGLFEGRRASLIDGQIIEEGPMNPPHRLALELTDVAVRTVFGTGWRVCVQMPLVLGQTTDPEPDIAIIPGSPRGQTSHPGTAALVIEVADSSLTHDQTVKAEQYARAGIADYWILDVDGKRLLVLRDPYQHPAGGYTFRTHLALGPTDTIAPLAIPNASIRVADLLP
ncbi:MAG: Uma2 family endonuclease [Gemmataceae bacterium]